MQPNSRQGFQCANSMPRSRKLILLAAAACALFANCPVAAALAAGVAPFDGTWNVVVACAHAPDGALPYSWQFTAKVRDSNLLGHYQQPGMVPSGTLSGYIEPDGNALLAMQGLTGNSRYVIGRVSPGTPFHYSVTAHFDAAHGSGERNEMRHCDLTFVRQ